MNRYENSTYGKADPRRPGAVCVSSIGISIEETSALAEEFGRISFTRNRRVELPTDIKVDRTWAFVPDPILPGCNLPLLDWVSEKRDSGSKK
jgi:hypothetical protein